jgi:hypothetical protein
MPTDRTPLHKLTASELLNLWSELQDRLPPEVADFIGEPASPLPESAQDVRTEIVRRLHAKDPELDAISAQRLEAEGARLVSPMPEGVLSQEEIVELSDIALKHQLTRVKQQYEFEAAAPTSESDDLERSAIESRKNIFKSCLASFVREMIRRGLSPDFTSPSESQKKSRIVRKVNPEVAKRRAIVARNLGRSAAEVCGLFDLDSVPLPSGFENLGGWKEAYNEPRFRSRVDTLISKDRKHTRRS